MEKSTVFIAGIGTGIIGMYVVAKLLRPTIKARLSTIGAQQIIRFAQQNGVPIATLGFNEVFLRTQLLDPAIDEALNAAYL